LLIFYEDFRELYTGTYKVVKGDTAFKISHKYGIAVRELS